ncbi:hypothetical protein [Marinicrinis lubricantis]|uniref:Uncharacterized protein n=1 Tax=Marinicrinis lubricantis TaxID=2086470 RepID=A0ABW1IJI9_9BACL
MDNDRGELQHLIRRFDPLFDRFYEWLANQYDAVSGGFYYAQSSREMEGSKPDIESTAQALSIIERSGLLPDMPVKVRSGLVHFFQQKQDPATGFFIDENPAMRKDEVMVARAMGYCLRSLKQLGAAPLYPLPQEDKAPEFMESADSYIRHLASINLSNSWRGCDRLASTSVYFVQLPEAKRQEYAERALAWFADIQDPETGLWGDGSLYVRISGTFKLHTFYSRFRAPMPRIDEMYQSILRGLRTEEAADMCYIRNPIHLLSYIQKNIAQEELMEIIGITIRNMEELKRPDGGFSREKEHSPTAPNVAQVKKGEYYPDMPEPVHLGLGLREGDMNAGTQALLIRELCSRLAGVQENPLQYDAASFYQMLPRTEG